MVEVRCIVVVWAALAAASAAGADGWERVNEPRPFGAGMSFPAVAYNPTTDRLEVVAFTKTHIQHGTADGRLNIADLEPAVELPERREGEYNSPHLIVDGKGVAHLVFAYQWASASTECWYTNNAGGVWKKPLLCLSARRSPDQMNRVNYPRVAVIGDTAYVVAFVYKEYNGVIAKITNVADDRMAVERLVTIPQDNPYILLPEPGKLFVAGRYDYAYYSGVPEKLGGSRHQGKSHEMIGAAAGPDGVVHLIGMSGHKVTTMYYTNTARAAEGLAVINGETFHSDSDAELYVWPEIVVDANGLVYVAYRDFNDRKGKFVTIREGEYAEPVVFADELLRRIRYNVSATAAPAGGVYLAWHHNDGCFLTLVGAELERAETTDR